MTDLDSEPHNAAATPPPKPRRRLVEAATAIGAKGAAGLLRALGPERGGRLASVVARRILAPLVPETKLALANLALAFPEADVRQHRRILAGAWDNLARTMAELPMLRRLVLQDPDEPLRGLTDRIELVGGEWAERLQADGQTGIVFLAHLGNWEVIALAAQSFGVDFVSLFRPPHNQRLQADLAAWRGQTDGFVPSGPGAATAVARAMQRGAHLAMQMDQRFSFGPRVPFFGHPAATNPIVARLARQFDCPVHGARAIRLPGTRFRVEMTPPILLPRDDDGRIDVIAATAKINLIIEAWVREHPDQWLWQHSRWAA